MNKDKFKFKKSIERTVKNIKFTLNDINLLDVISLLLIVIVGFFCYKPIEPSGKVDISTLFSVLFGGIITYYYNVLLEYRKKIEDAKTSAILIRNWLREKLDEIVNLKNNLKDKYDLLSTISLNEMQTDVTGETRRKFIAVIQDLPTNRGLFQFDPELINRLAYLKKRFSKFEVLLQNLNLANNAYLQGVEKAALLNRLKLDFINDNKSSKPSIVVTQELLWIFQKYIPDYISIMEDAQKKLGKVFDIFQSEICFVLDIENILLSERKIEI